MKQFCKRGHDISLVGRHKGNNGCKKCSKDRAHEWHCLNDGLPEIEAWRNEILLKENYYNE